MSETLNQLQASLDELVVRNPEKLVRTEYLGASFDFGDHVPLFDQVLGLFKELREADLAGMPDSQIEMLQQLTDQTVECFRQIETFEPKEVPNPAEQRNHLAEMLKGTYQNVFSTVSSAVAYASSRGIDLRRAQREIKDAVEEIEQIKSETASELQSHRDSAASIVASMREAAGEVGVGQKAVQFLAEAKRHREAKATWLKASIWVGVAGVVLAAGNLGFLLANLDETSKMTTGGAIQLGVGKVLLFSVLYYSLIWVVRTYQAASHNEVVNQHRANALGTFETFVAAATDEQTKQAVLLLATECIFGHQVSGYSEPGRDDGGSSKLLEIVRGAGSDTGGR